MPQSACLSELHANQTETEFHILLRYSHLQVVVQFVASFAGPLSCVLLGCGTCWRAGAVGFFCAASGELVRVRLVLINVDIYIDDYNLEKKYLWRLRTSGGRSVNTWRISPPVCLSYVFQHVDLQPHRLPLGLGSLIPHGFGSQIPNFVLTW